MEVALDTSLPETVTYVFNGDSGTATSVSQSFILHCCADRPIDSAKKGEPNSQREFGILASFDEKQNPSSIFHPVCHGMELDQLQDILRVVLSLNT